MINQTISLCQKIETVQYNAALAITGAVKGTSQMKVKKKSDERNPAYPNIYAIPQTIHPYKTRSIEDVKTFYCRTDVFK